MTREKEHGDVRPDLRAMPRLNGAVLSANVAQDPSGRMSAHGIFTVVSSVEAPFEFQAPVYVTANITDVPAGAHVFKVNPADGLIFEAEAISSESVAGDVLVIFTVNNCRIDRFGAHRVVFTVDDVEVDGSVLLRLQKPAVAES